LLHPRPDTHAVRALFDAVRNGVPQRLILVDRAAALSDRILMDFILLNEIKHGLSPFLVHVRGG
jgi:hypothetical protein